MRSKLWRDGDTSVAGLFFIWNKTTGFGGGRDDGVGAEPDRRSIGFVVRDAFFACGMDGRVFVCQGAPIV